MHNEIMHERVYSFIWVRVRIEARARCRVMVKVEVGTRIQVATGLGARGMGHGAAPPASSKCQFEPVAGPEVLSEVRIEVGSEVQPGRCSQGHVKVPIWVNLARARKL